MKYYPKNIDFKRSHKFDKGPRPKIISRIGLVKIIESQKYILETDRDINRIYRKEVRGITNKE